MVYASYCAFYPKWPCVKYEANIWYSCCYDIILFQNFLLPSLKFYDQCCDHTIRCDRCNSVTNHF